MPRAAKLKVYRTAIGFHDAYVAAPSQKAALAAWGSDKDLFARGVAELVMDEALTAEALAAPLTVVKRLRGTTEEQIAALPAEKPKRKRAPEEEDGPSPLRSKNRRTPASSRSRAAEHEAPVPTASNKAAPARVQRRTGAAPRPKPRPAPKPRPSRAELDEAERAISTAEERHAAELAELRRRQEALARQRRQLDHRQAAELSALEEARNTADRAFRKAMAEWAETT